MPVLLVYPIVVVCIFAVMLSLGQQPRFMKRLTGILLLCVSALGIVLYGYGYYELYGNVPQTTARTLFSVFCMFFGKDNIKDVSAVPLLAKPFMQIVLFLTHAAALYCTASAVVQAIGTRLVRLTHLLFVRRGKLHLIYGVNEDSIAFGQKLLDRRAGTVVFVDAGGGAPYDTKILRMGSILFGDGDAKSASAAFLKRIGLKKGERQMTVYCLDENPEQNHRYAKLLQKTLEASEIHASQTTLIAVLPAEADGAQLQAGARGAAFGAVHAFETYDLIARLAVHTLAPYRTMTFDKNGRAEEPFEALIIGFGKCGQAMLRALVMNGQFAGSAFKATVVALNADAQSGAFLHRYAGIPAAYDITFLDADARSASFYETLRRIGPRLKYIAVCTGDERINREIAQEYAVFCKELGVRAAILECSYSGVLKREDAFGPAVSARVCSPEVLSGEALDAMAKIVNHQYHIGEGFSAEADWEKCDYFSRMSCRAVADFSDAMLAAAGTTREAVLSDGFHPSAELLETLSETEHARWCGFHYAMGYRTMPQETWNARAEQYRREVAQNGSSRLRIGKDTAERLHACLIPWDALDALSARESAITGAGIDYRGFDRDNVLMLERMVRAMHDLETN